MDAFYDRLQNQLTYARKKVTKMRAEHTANPEKEKHYHWGWDLGYWEGRAVVLEEVLAERKAYKKKKKKEAKKNE